MPRWRNWQTHRFEVAASNIVQVQILSWALKDHPAAGWFFVAVRSLSSGVAAQVLFGPLTVTVLTRGWAGVIRGEGTGRPG